MKPEEDTTESISHERPKIELWEGMSGLTLNEQYFKHMKEISKKEERIKMGESGQEVGMVQQGNLSSLEMNPMGAQMPQTPPMHPQTLSAFPSSSGGSKPELQNIVSTVNMGCKLDLQTIALNARNAEYNPRRFAAVIMRIREPKTTALIFHSGKMVCTGAKCEDESKTAAKRYTHIIKKIGFPAKFGEFKIQNIIASCDVGFSIRLEGLNNEHGTWCHYRPEIFPGLIYRMHEPKIILLIFISGKIVLMGARQREDLYTAYENIHPVLIQFKKKPN